MMQSTIAPTPTFTGKLPHRYSVTVNGQKHGKPRPEIKHNSLKQTSQHQLHPVMCRHNMPVF